MKEGVLKTSPLTGQVGRWAASMGIDAWRLPTPAALEAGFRGQPEPCRGGVDPRELDAWENRHGYRLPEALRAWLLLSNGLYAHGPLIHPLFAIGPMVPFARMPGLVVQPESWFEIGNPNIETVCIDLAYTWPGSGAGSPVFTSGDDRVQSPPRIIATSFDDWFLGLLHRGGREFWFDDDFDFLGDPWVAHRKYAPTPPLPDRLRPFADRLPSVIGPGLDDRAIAHDLGISRGDVEMLFRHIQHGANGIAAS